MVKLNRALESVAVGGAVPFFPALPTGERVGLGGVGRLEFDGFGNSSQITCLTS
jgi:hypothetical protein